VLYRNVDLRQVELAFNNSERIAAVLVQEGDRVQRGQVLARLDGSRLEPEVAEAEARAAAQHQGLKDCTTSEKLSDRPYLRVLDGWQQMEEYPHSVPGRTFNRQSGRYHHQPP
jgi:HlyD family secretion protein